jgi:hypothetical protein
MITIYLDTDESQVV